MVRASLDVTEWKETDISDEIPNDARDHHYLFSHEWLRSSFQRIPETMMRALVRTESAAPVRESWVRLGKSLDEELRLEPPSFEVQLHEFASDWRVAVVSLADAEAPGEAHFVALAVRAPDGQLTVEGDEGPRSGVETRYALLESTDAAEGRVRIERDGDLVALGARAAPNQEAFVETLREELAANDEEPEADHDG